MFAVAGMLGTLPVFQINQLVQLLRDVVAIPAGLVTAENHVGFDFVVGVVLSIVLFMIAAGKVERVSAVAGKLVPGMVIFYFALTGYLLIINIASVPAMLKLIIADAFSGEAVSG